MPNDDAVAVAVARIDAAGTSSQERAAIYADILRDAHFIDHLASLDEGERAAALTEIKGSLKRSAKIDDLKAAVVAVLRGRQHAGAQRKPLFGLTLPPGYLIDHGGALVQVHVDDEGRERRHLVSHRPIAVTRHLYDPDAEEVHVELTWGTGRTRGSESAVVPRATVAKPISLIEAVASHAKEGAPVHTGNGAAVVTFLAAQEAANDRTMPTAALARSLGWCGPYFVAGSEVLAEDGRYGIRDAASPVALDRSSILRDIARRIHRSGTPEGWADAVCPALDRPVLAMLICASLAPVLLACLPGQPSAGILDLAGPPQTGKTCALELIAGTVWGPPTPGAGIVIAANGSDAGLRDHRLANGGLPLIVNETQLLRNQPELLESLPFQIYEGAGKILSARSAEPARTIRSSAIFCGNTALVDMAEIEGIRSRVLTSRSSPWGPRSDVTGLLIQHIALETIEHYGHLGPDFAAFLIRHRDRWPDYRRAWQTRARHWTATIGPSADRAGFILAIYELAGLICKRELGLSALNLDGAMAEAVQAARDSLSNADEPLRALRMVVGWAASNTHQLDGNSAALPSGARIGRWDSTPGSPLYLLQSPLCDRLRSKAISPETTIRHWIDRGWLICDPQRRTSRATVGGKRTPCYCIGPAGLDAAGARQELTDAELDHEREEAAR